MRTFPVGDFGHTLRIAQSWRVLDVGSGQSPNPRADVLLERYPLDDRHRAGDPMDVSDERLVIGDACDMPFRSHEFDYVIASHIAEHVEDPLAFCREVTRVGRRGYIETPGWLGDLLLREDFHLWRVRRKGRGLEFSRVKNQRPMGKLGDLFYAAVYAGVPRDGHWTPQAKGRIGTFFLKSISWVMAKIIVSRPLRRYMYLAFEWEGPFPTIIR